MSLLAEFFFGHWLFHPLVGRGYQFYSGVAGLINLSFLFAFMRRHNCHVHGCLRLAHRLTAAGDAVCRRHHPETPKTVQQVHADHHDAVRRVVDGG